MSDQTAYQATYRAENRLTIRASQASHRLAFKIEHLAKRAAYLSPLHAMRRRYQLKREAALVALWLADADEAEREIEMAERVEALARWHAASQGERVC